MNSVILLRPNLFEVSPTSESEQSTHCLGMHPGPEFLDCSRFLVWLRLGWHSDRCRNMNPYRNDDGQALDSAQ